MTILALGSINIDLVVRVPHLPSQGETVIGDHFWNAPGGKAANQAICVAKLGIPSYLIGQVGNDAFGNTLLENLQQEGVNISGIRINPEIYTGVAAIVVNQQGDNTIACAAGANSCLNQEDINRFDSLLPQAKLVLMELGIPLNIVLEAAQKAHQAGVIVILDPAPAPDQLPMQLYECIDIITPNEIEASQLVGFTVDNSKTAAQAAEIFLGWGVKTVIITLGKQGAFWATKTDTGFTPAIKVNVIDTVGAGDAFNGALACALVLGKSLPEAIRWGTVAGALAVTKPGAATSLPSKSEFYDLLNGIANC